MAKRFQWIPYFESVQDNPYLSDFYANMKRWSFNLQIYFLAHRFRTHKEITELQTSVIQDRSIYEDVEIFARNLYELGNMDKRDYETYSSLFKEMTAYLAPPDILIYLRASIPTLISQIRKRGREYEMNIDKNYLSRLNESYEQWIENYNLGKKIIIDTDNLDFVHSEKDFETVISTIEKQLSLDLKLFT
jgi:deoxyadenosine/deoxycytidine kinase